MSLALDRIQALCFDVDGTIADTDDHLVTQVARLLYAVPLMSGRRAERLARQLVMGAALPVNKAYGWLDRLHLDGPFHRLRARAARARQASPGPAHAPTAQAADEVPHEMVAGVQEMIECLAARYPMCAISTGTVPRIERFLTHYGVRRHFSAVIGAQTTRRLKPHPEPLLHAAEVMGVAPSACLMIGDTRVDIDTGVAAGAQTVGVLCGFGREEELREAGADLILPTTSDLLAVLLPSRDALGKSAVPHATLPPAGLGAMQRS
ncbi:HAD family hydrolase [Ramlibacter rhizophilus]|uniref:phosphoglycolate phosphatase n=1 Tax=Ramlibacter rhizophilus TaxID=1781167 RepID=A0A4Z0BI97_9BURK|nr:HAD family hydrolase [Ramlibacter rhizophilus]TFY98441.1 HAD family hydrolase [Ramlibacter rhizophilus]